MKKKKSIRKNHKNIGCGPRIRQWRKKRGIKSFGLAKILKVSQGSLSDIENEKSNPSALTIQSFILNTNINVFWMMTGQDGDIKNGEIANDDIQVFNLKPGNKIILVECDK